MDYSPHTPLRCYTVYRVVYDPAEHKDGSDSTNDEDFDSDPDCGAHGTAVDDFTASSPKEALQMAARSLGYPDAEAYSNGESMGDFDVWLDAVEFY